MRWFLLTLMLAGCATTAPAPATKTDSPTNYEAIVTAPDRTDDDRKLDPGRKPAEYLAALAVKPGMKVGELVCGGGYTTELLARAVGPNGTVYGENPKWLLERFAEKPWSERLARPVNANVKRLDREPTDPFPPELNGTLDVVVTNANYHDMVWQKVDTAKMNAGVFAALKSGGHYVVSDSSAKAGSGPEVAEQLHRISEDQVKSEVTAVGFKLARSDDALRNPADARDWNASPRLAADKRGTSDRFILIFEKP
ncbi:MAG: SAM-dependent methyltransferase [Myxococcaceae bacterium]